MICFVASSGTQPTEGGRHPAAVAGRVESEDEEDDRSFAERVGEGHLEFSGLSRR